MPNSDAHSVELTNLDFAALDVFRDEAGLHLELPVPLGTLLNFEYTVNGTTIRLKASVVILTKDYFIIIRDGEYQAQIMKRPLIQHIGLIAWT